MPRLVIISNRLPITITEQDGKLQYKPSAGGLATGLNSLGDSIERIWIGWPGIDIQSEEKKEGVREDLLEHDLIPVFLSQQEIQLYYEGFSNKTIWPHFHYFTQYTAYEDHMWEAYQRVNQKFAEAVIPHIREDDLVWVHDYQLMLLPNMIRQEFPDISIGFFLHIPFPSYEIFRILPWRKQILEGILGANLIGFHTFGYMRHFLSAAYRITGHEHNFGHLKIGNRLVNVDVFPMGIDYEKYAHPEFNLLEENAAFKIKQLAKGNKLVISIDRLDYSKGIPNRIKVMEAFLDRYPEYTGKVILVMVVVPSRANVDEYQDLKHQIDTLVGEVNGRFRTFDWAPIRYFYRSLNFEELMTLYQEADIAMITPLRDGMNLVAKEYVASKEDSKKGVLILSEMAGSSSDLHDAITVNPNDLNDIVGALKQAIEMNEKEQRWRIENMQKRLRKYTVQHWANTFMSEQKRLMEEQKKQRVYRLQGQARKDLIKHYQSAKKRLIIIDYDGTLMNFDPNPQAVVPDQAVLETLQLLKKDPANKVIVSSGRDRQTLEKWLGELQVDMAAEHGVWIKKDDEWQSSPNLGAAWKSEIKEILEDLVERTPGSFIEEKDYSVAWHYRRIDKDLGAKRVREFRDVLRYLTANLDLQVLEGNKVVEIKNAGVNKGKAVLNWINENDWDFFLAIGDDHTDEDTFEALPKEAYTIKVGIDRTSARFSLASVEEVRAFLNELNEA
jgi:trehalose 6-phosphate synthase/phosphatase